MDKSNWESGNLIDKAIRSSKALSLSQEWKGIFVPSDLPSLFMLAQVVRQYGYWHIAKNGEIDCSAYTL